MLSNITVSLKVQLLYRVQDHLLVYVVLKVASHPTESNKHFTMEDLSTSRSLSNLERTFSHLTLEANAGHSHPPSSYNIHNAPDPLSRLWKIDKDCNDLMKATLLMMDSLASSDALPAAQIVASLDRELQWMTLAMAELQGLESHTDTTIIALARAMTGRLSELRVSLLSFKGILIDRTPPTYDSRPFETGTLASLPRSNQFVNSFYREILQRSSPEACPHTSCCAQCDGTESFWTCISSMVQCQSQISQAIHGRTTPCRRSIS